MWQQFFDSKWVYSDFTLPRGMAELPQARAVPQAALATLRELRQNLRNCGFLPSSTVL